MRVGAVVLFVVIVGLAVAGWRWLYPDDEAAIRQSLSRIAAAVGSEPGEPGLARLARLQRLGDELTADVQVDAGPPIGRLAGRADATAAAARVSASLRALELRFVDVTVVVQPDGQTALVSLTAEARFEDGAGDGFDARELDVTFVRTDGQWRVQSVASIRVLQPVGLGPASGRVPVALEVS
ncbi:MAG: nuclear transport factor 2 family protein [Vicinamibacterales bacterium]